MTTSSVEPGYKYVARRDDSPTSSDTQPGVGLGPVADAFGKIINGIVETIGKVLGGAADLAVGAFEWILTGVRQIFTGIFQTIGAIFSKDPKNVVPDYMSPIRADLEAAVKPMFDRIEENNKEIEAAMEEVNKLLARQKELTNKYGKVMEEQAAIREDQEKIYAEIDTQIESLESASAKVAKTVDELVAFKDGMDARIKDAMEAMKADLDLAKQLENAQAEVEKKIAEGLNKGGELASKIAELTASPDGQSFADFWQANGQTLLKMQSWYNDWNRGQWESQKEWNALQANWNARVTATLDRQVSINADQGTFNEFVRDFVKVQRWYNENNDSLWKLQQAFNDKTTGWQKKQDELNTLSRDFQREQTATSNQFLTIITRLKNSQDQLAEIAKEQAEFIFRKMIAQRNGTQATENEHWRVRPDTGELVAKGSWSGEVSVRVYGTKIRHGDDNLNVASEELYPIPLLSGSRTIQLPNGIGSPQIDTVALDYSVARGRRIIDVYPSGSKAGSYTPASSKWVRLNRFTATRTTTHRFTFDVVWDAATFHNRYGIRVRRNGTTIASIGPRDGVGPLTPLGSGVRPMSIDEQSVSLTKGQYLDFEVYTEGDSASSRTLQTYTRTVSYQQKD